MASFALAAIFMLAAASKLHDPRPPSVLRKPGPVGDEALLRATRTIAVGELALAAALLSPLLTAAAVIALAFLVVTGALVLFHDRGNAPDCGCFGSQLQVHDRQLRAIRHLGFLALGFIAVLTPGAQTLFDALAGICAGIAFVLIWPLLGGVTNWQEVHS